MKPKLKFLSVEYEMLVAAWFMRNLDFASRAYPILSMAHKHFWGRETIKHVVEHQLAHFALNHKLLGQSTLRADFSMKAPEGTSSETLMLLVDRLWEIDLGDMDYILEGLGKAAKERLLLAVDKDTMVTSGQADELVAVVKQIDDLSRVGGSDTDKIFHLADDLEYVVAPVEDGIASPWNSLNSCLTAGGLTDGESCICAAPFNTGKSPFIAAWGIHAAWNLAQPTVFFTYETSRKNTQNRILRTLTGWSAEMVRANPTRYREHIEETYGNIPFFVRYRPTGTHSVPQLEADVMRVEDQIGQKVRVVCRDYGELSWEAKQGGGDYRAVREAYSKFRAFLGRTGRVGLDCAQLNRNNVISNFDILKDADVGVQLEKAQGSEVLLVQMMRVREGSGGRDWHLQLDLKNGRMTEWTAPQPVVGMEDVTPTATPDLSGALKALSGMEG